MTPKDRQNMTYQRQRYRSKERQLKITIDLMTTELEVEKTNMGDNEVLKFRSLSVRNLICILLVYFFYLLITNRYSENMSHETLSSTTEAQCWPFWPLH